MNNSETIKSTLVTAAAPQMITQGAEDKRREYHLLGVLHIETVQGHWFIDKSEGTLYLYDYNTGKCVDSEERNNAFSIYDNNQYNSLINRNL
jgi:hypothetical protein